MPQTPAEADIRGNDWSAAEHDRAVAHGQNQLRLSAARMRYLNMLKGNPAAMKSLQHNWLPLARSSPAYHEFP